MFWDRKSASCQCPRGQQWRDNSCRFPPLQPPRCPWGQRPYCCRGLNLQDRTPYGKVFFIGLSSILPFQCFVSMVTCLRTYLPYNEVVDDDG
ncbi:hypothetical protein GGS20DRAFT_539554 [Poronia punctata]|nr:hypothetical protein GGS20DRAFT_539554 [Poronia punctata]